MESKVAIINGNVWQRIFSLPKKIIKFILKNANAKIMRKLYQTCKYFYKKAPYCIVDKIKFKSFKHGRLELDDFDDWIDVYDNDDFKLFDNVWVTKKIIIHSLESDRFLYSKIVRSYACKISLHFSSLTFKEYIILTKSGKVEELSLQHTSIKYADEDVPLEYLLELIPRAFSIWIWVCHVTPQTMEKLMKIQWKNKFTKFFLHIINEVPLDKELFFKFIKQNAGKNVKVKYKLDGNYGRYTFSKSKSCNFLKTEDIDEPPNKKMKLDVSAKETEAVNQKGLPKPIINYIIEAANEEVMKKLHRTCKYFFKKAPYLFVDEINTDYLKLNKEIVDAENFKGKNCWVTGTYFIEQINNGLDLLFPKIKRCNRIVPYCTLPQKFLELIGKFERLKDIWAVKIIDEIENIIPLEKALLCLINVEKITIEGCHVSNQTLTNLIELPWKNNLKKQYLVYIDKILDVKLFYKFLQKALSPKAKVLVHFVDFDENEEGRIAFNKAMKREIETWRPKKERPSFRVITKEDAQNI